MEQIPADLPMSEQQQVQAYMRSRVEEHLQARMWHPYGLRVTGVNCTELAEDAANHFNAYEPPNAALPDRFVAWAIEIAQEQA
jgi:hypothetical protein